MEWKENNMTRQKFPVREVVARSMKELEKSGAIRIEDRRFPLKMGTSCVNGRTSNRLYR
jgi:hypothetical protein